METVPTQTKRQTSFTRLLKYLLFLHAYIILRHISTSSQVNVINHSAKNCLAPATQAQLSKNCSGSSNTIGAGISCCTSWGFILCGIGRTFSTCILCFIICFIGAIILGGCWVSCVGFNVFAAQKKRVLSL